MKSIYLLYLFLIATSFSCSNNQKAQVPVNSDQPRNQTIEEFNHQVLTLLKNREYKNLADHIDKEGIRLSPYGYIDLKDDVVLSKSQFLLALEKPHKIRFGYYDGSGDPIELTLEEFLDKFGYTHDFISKGVSYKNEIKSYGNSLNNTMEVYPNHQFIETYVKGEDPRYGGMDWGVIRIIVSSGKQKYFIAALVHDQWTI